VVLLFVRVLPAHYDSIRPAAPWARPYSRCWLTGLPLSLPVVMCFDVDGHRREEFDTLVDFAIEKCGPGRRASKPFSIPDTTGAAPLS